MSRSFVGRLLTVIFLLTPLYVHGAPPGEKSRPQTPLEAREAQVDRLMRTGRGIEAFSEAVQVLRERLAVSGPRSPEGAYALRRVAFALRNMADVELVGSVSHLAGLSAAAALGPCHWIVIESMTAEAVSARWSSPTAMDITGPLNEARSMLDLTRPEDRVVAARICSSLGVSYWRRDLPRSIETEEESVQLLEATPDTLQRAITRSILAWTLSQAGREDEARIELEKCRAEMTQLGVMKPGSLGSVEKLTGDFAVLSGDWEGADRHYRSALDLSAAERRETCTRFRETSLDGYTELALVDLKRGRYANAWQCVQSYRGQLNKRMRSLARMAERAPDTYARARKLRDAVDASRELRRQRQLPRTLDEVNWAEVLHELEANAALFTIEADYYAPEVVQAAPLAELQASLPRNYAYIGWLVCRIGDGLLVSPGRILDSCWMYVVRSEGPVHWIPLWESSSVAAQNALRKPAGEYGNAMARASSWTLRVSDDPRLAHLARVLGDQEFNAALPFLDGVDCLEVEFFDDRVGWKPVEALKLPDGRYVGDRFAVAYSPSADAFIASRQKPRAEKKKVLVIGDPVFNPETETTLQSMSAGTSSRLPVYDRTLHRAASFGDPNALTALPPLRYAKTEIGNLHRIFPNSTILCRNDATEANVRRLVRNGDMAKFDIIHFATHALTESPLAQNHSLALTRLGIDESSRNDGVIDGVEMQLGWDLNAELVTLSGCRTLSGANWARGEPTGLAGIMLGIGARSVLATQWNVDDLAAAKLNTRFYENVTGKHLDGRVGRPMTKAAALAEAKRWLREYRDKDGKRPFAHPVYWSGFILLGSPD